MKKMTKIFFGLLMIFSLTIAYAANSFVVKQIQINGLKGISKETVLNYLPIKVGQRFSTAKTGQVLKQLYQTGFFDDVQLAQQGQTLIVNVIQRPIISHITISGNKTIPTDKLQEALTKMNFASGQIFSPLLLTRIKTSLSQEYFSIGKYNATVDIQVIPQTKHRVAIHIHISEGKIAKITEIKIIGNHAFHDSTLLKQFELTKPGILTLLTQKDQYSEEKLRQALDTLQKYYMDRGYIKFKINSAQVSITPERRHVYISIYITEGGQYRFGDYKFAGNLVLPEAKLRSFVQFEKGQIFSRQAIMDTSRLISRLLGNKGYAKADVNAIPMFNEKQKTVAMNFVVKPGKQIYVRRITFSDNYQTNDKALRRALKQFEGELYSVSKIEGSKRALLVLPSENIRNVTITTQAVPEKPNQVDINYQVQEVPSASIKAGIAYSQLNRFMITGGINQKNVLGTGNILGLNISNSRPSTSISLSYYNPYYKQSGIGRSISIYSQRFDSSKANISNYATNAFGVSVGYNYRVAENDNIQLGYGYQNEVMKVGNSLSAAAEKFINEHGRHFYYATTNLGWSHNTFDRSIFPTHGLYQSAGVSVTLPIAYNSLTYYKMHYLFTYYHHLYHHFIGQAKFTLNYGDGYGHYQHELPFFKNFYAGGINSVRGYSDNTLGPRDPVTGDPLGGNFEVNGTIGLVFPNLISDNVRTTWFADGGAVHSGIKLSGIRYSTGIAIDWLSPVGLLNFSFAKPINKHHGDETETFQFNIGVSF